ncbi:GNAT family N-acetyltransferase [Dehalogenimonas alkenigignens]|uniref:Acetyltransferase n=1 Tax=Dehalogenimonas alkenigignens TaxID=1217799 RepID=A0A0W0GHS0_9CHLR|nr:GNAT family N-acetyltransferase [Dehalogenimonas alkenigignens]KTB48092.1 Acetyltransferase [Dehalogenimonas alkenigignens]PVV84344.1 GNAT family N-acetyltransferase [Dehalogenimonas alkenigignens]
MTVEPAIRRAESRDIPVIVHYNMALAAETEKRHLDQATVTAGVTAFLEHPEYGFYIIAEAGGEPVAQTMITYEWSDWRNGVIWWIQSVYVSAAWRRLGLYRKLYQQVRELAAQDGGVKELRLYVDQDNTAARQTYQALGMMPSRYLLYEADI